jgi:hypothetical protein
MARISLNPRQTLGYGLGARFSRPRYGTMLDPGAVTTVITGGRISAIHLITNPDKLQGLGAGRILSR